MDTVKITKKLIPIKKCVKDRREWVKYGEVEGYARGQHRKGDYTVGQNLKIETMDSN